MTIDIFNTENRYDLILADPPWKQSKGGKKSVRANSSGRPLDYQVCTLEEIEEHLKAAVSLTGGGIQYFSYGRSTNTYSKRRKSPNGWDTNFTPA